MGELSSAMKMELLNRMREHNSTVEYSNQGWDSVPITFQDSCDCYSEYTTESCRLEVTVCVQMPEREEDRVSLSLILNDAVSRWARENLEWSGCVCCNNNLSVWVRVFDKAKEQHEREAQ